MIMIIICQVSASYNDYAVSMADISESSQSESSESSDSSWSESSESSWSESSDDDAFEERG